MNCTQALSIVLILTVFCSDWIGGLEIACPEGWVSANGKFPDCRVCPLGTYQKSPTRCKPCPSNTTTEELGATSKEQCISVDNSNSSGDGEPCEAGSYSSTGYSPCKPCDIGYYSASVNSTTCTKCPSKKITVSRGAIHRRNCTKIKNLVPCPQGSISSSGYQPCSTCAIGYYQPHQGQQVCAKCPEGLSNEAEGAIDCINITATLKTTFNYTTVKYKKLKGVKLTRLNKLKGFISSANYPNNYMLETMQQWKINCFDGEHVGVITSHMDLTEGDYLQVQDDQYSGKMPHPIGSIIRKNSVGVIFSGQNGNSTGFQSSFLCVEQHKRAWAESIFHNKKVMEVIKPANDIDTVGVEKAIDLVLNYPLAIFTGYNDPHQRKILQIVLGDIQ